VLVSDKLILVSSTLMPRLFFAYDGNLTGRVEIPAAPPSPVVPKAFSISTTSEPNRRPAVMLDAAQIAIVGRPKCGQITPLNRLAGRTAGHVHDTPGVTATVRRWMRSMKPGACACRQPRDFEDAPASCLPSDSTLSIPKLAVVERRVRATDYRSAPRAGAEKA